MALMADEKTQELIQMLESMGFLEAHVRRALLTGINPHSANAMDQVRCFMFGR